MKRCVVTLILIGALAGCSREDVDQAKQKLKDAGQEIKKEVDEGSKAIKQKADEASREIKKEVNEAKRDLGFKDTSHSTR
jgi:biotin operon repressor